MKDVMKEIKMLDTIVLSIPKGQYTIFDHDKFQPSTEPLFNLNLPIPRNLAVFKQNPTKADKDNGIYKPRLTITNRLTPKGWELPLRIEFSIPKMIYGDNINEVQETDYPQIADTLIKRLSEMGVKVFRFYLDKAPVSAVHFSKNFALSDYVSASLILKELEKINLNDKLDLSKTHFRNEGRAVYYYASNNHILFYDKLKDTNAPAKRAIDKDRTLQQMSLFETYKKEKRRDEIIRYEVRLNQRQRLKTALKQVGFNEDPTFQAVFNESLAQRVLLDYWGKAIDENMHIFQLSATKTKNILQNILKEPKIKLIYAMATLGTKYFTNEEGIKTLKSMIKHRYTNESWYRFNKIVKDIANQSFTTNFVTQELKKMKQELIDFKPFKFADLTKT